MIEISELVERLTNFAEHLDPVPAYADEAATLRKSAAELVRSDIRLGAASKVALALSEQVEALKAERTSLIETKREQIQRLTREVSTWERLHAEALETASDVDDELATAEARVAVLEEALRWFVDRQQPIQAKFAVHGPKDAADAMVDAFRRARQALSATT